MLGHPAQLSYRLIPYADWRPGGLAEWGLMGPGACKHELGDEGIHECRGTDVTKNSSGGDMAVLPPLVRSLSRTVFYHQFQGRVLAGILGTHPLAPTCNKTFFLCVSDCPLNQLKPVD